MFQQNYPFDHNVLEAIYGLMNIQDNAFPLINAY